MGVKLMMGGLMIADIGCHLDGTSDQLKHKLLDILGRDFLDQTV